MTSSHPTQPTTSWQQILLQVMQFLITMALFLAGAGLGNYLTDALLPDSGFASTIGTFALPMAFVASINLWIGAVMLYVISDIFKHLLQKSLRQQPSSYSRPTNTQALPGAWVFPLVIFVVSIVTAFILSLISANVSFFQAFQIYTGGCMIYAAICWFFASLGLVTFGAE